MKQWFIMLIIFLIILLLIKQEKSLDLFHVEMNYLKQLAMQSARRHDVNIILIFAIIKQESSWNPNVISPAGAVGLMQIMPKTALEECGIHKQEELLDPEINIDCGTRYFSKLLGIFQDVEKAVCAYNSGPGRVRKLGRCPNIKETKNYVRAVLTGWKK